MSAKINLIGQKFGMLIVIAETDKRSSDSICWLCRCDCGNEVIVSGDSLRSGLTKSCGCLRKAKAKERFTKHGKTKARTYYIWANMKDRCLNPNNDQYKDYGGRGIIICDRWLKFENFLADMGECPKSLSIERTDNDLGYYKENCIWATQKQQTRNRRSNLLIEFNGKTQCLAAWAEELGIGRQTLSNRLKRGWSIEKALITPVRKGKEIAI